MGAATPTHAAEDVSYLFVVDSSDIRVTPLQGDAARVEISGPAVTRFTDRPEREAERIGVRGMLREFGWTRATKRLMDSTPNASISIAGEHSRIVDIKRARVGDGRVVLRVVGINGALDAMRGAGSIFVDNAPTFPMSQTVTLTDTEVDSLVLGSASIELTSTSSATIYLVLDGSDMQQFTVTPGEPAVTGEWTSDDGMTSYASTIQSSITEFSVTFRITVDIDQRFSTDQVARGAAAFIL